MSYSGCNPMHTYVGLYHIDLDVTYFGVLKVGLNVQYLNEGGIPKNGPNEKVLH